MTEKKKPAIDKMVFTDNLRKSVIAECDGDETKADLYLEKARGYFRLNTGLTAYATADAKTAFYTQSALLGFASYGFGFAQDKIILEAPYNHTNKKGEWNKPVADLHYKGYMALINKHRENGFRMFSPVVVWDSDNFHLKINSSSTGHDVNIEHIPDFDAKGARVFDNIKCVYISWVFDGKFDTFVATRDMLQTSRDIACQFDKTNYKRGNWDKHAVSLAKKTALRRAMVFLPITVKDMPSDDGDLLQDMIDNSAADTPSAAEPQTAPEASPKSDDHIQQAPTGSEKKKPTPKKQQAKPPEQDASDAPPPTGADTAAADNAGGEQGEEEIPF